MAGFRVSCEHVQRNEDNLVGNRTVLDQKVLSPDAGGRRSLKPGSPKAVEPEKISSTDPNSFSKPGGRIAVRLGSTDSQTFSLDCPSRAPRNHVPALGRLNLP